MEVEVPNDLQVALEEQPNALAVWHELTPISRRDYIAWINEAKQLPTREKRIRICCENLIKGKKRPCCFAVVPMDFYKALGADPQAKSAWSRLTASAKRDLTDWIDKAETKDERKQRISQACANLVSSI